MQLLIIAAVAALASASTVTRCGDCAAPAPIKFEKKCVVVAEEDNFTLGVGKCSEAVKFQYHVETHQLVSDVEGKCVAAIEVDDETVVALVECEDEEAHHWKPQKGDKWLCEKTCECITVNKHGHLVFGPCKKAKKCGMEVFPEVVEAVCKPVPKPAEACGAMPACPSTCTCEEKHCVQPLECYADKDCAYGQACNNGWCVYKKPTCGNGVVCPAPYVCDEYCGQCVLPPSKCPPGYEQEGYWCVPIKPECSWNNPCPAGYYCDCGRCVAEKVGCEYNSDCAVDQVCEHNICVKAPECLVGCMGDCIHGECVPKCTSDAQCAVDEACMGGICVTVGAPCNSDVDCPSTEACTESGRCAYQVTCDECPDSCDHGVCGEINDSRRAAPVMGWF